MNLIKVTSHRIKDNPIYINVDTITHIYEEIQVYYTTTEKFTIIGTMLNNDGFKVSESVDTVLNLIKDSKLKFGQ